MREKKRRGTKSSNIDTESNLTHGDDKTSPRKSTNLIDSSSGLQDTPELNNEKFLGPKPDEEEKTDETRLS